jgi:hypothetical protein
MYVFVIYSIDGCVLTCLRLPPPSAVLCYCMLCGRVLVCLCVYVGRGEVSLSACHLLTCWFLLKLFLRHWRWRRYVPPKRQLELNGLHGVISQKMILFITTTVKTSNSTRWKLFLCFSSQAPCHEDVWGNGGIAPPFLTLALDGVSGLLLAPAALPPGKDPGIHWIGGWVGPSVKKRQIVHLRESNPGRPARHIQE